MVKLTALVAAAVAIAGWISPDAGPAAPGAHRTVPSVPDAPVTAHDAATLVAAHGVEPAAPSGAARLTIARLQYDGGGDWYANPSSLPNLLAAIAERTTLKVERTEARTTLMDDRLWDYPFLHVTGHGNIHFSDAEIVRLREYLAR